MLPLLDNLAPSGDLFLHADGVVGVEEFLGAAQSLADRLGDERHVMNLCDDRYQFAVGFAAALLNGQTTLMPPNRAPELISSLLADYPDTRIVWDRGLPGLPPPPVPVTETTAIPPAHDTPAARQPAVIPAIPLVPADLEAVVAFTSGSTGKPKPNIKTWAALHIGTGMAATRFFANRGGHQIVATVPPQHMYGLETSVLYAMLAGCPTSSGRPFFPADVATALASLSAPRVLVTTPAHLRALVKAGVTLPNLEFMISATAPLPLSLAQQAESMFHTEVREIYGCTEAGSLASRRQTASGNWQLYDGMTLTPANGSLLLAGPQLSQAVPLQDQIDLLEDGCFALRGRNEDMLNIAGKRASLADLTNTLLEIDGVEDAVMIAPDDSDDARVGRVAGLVVAPGLSAEEVLAALRPKIDPAFLPRPLLNVAALPRNAASKLPRSAVLELLQRELQAHKAEQA